MTRLEQLTATAKALSAQQLDGLLQFADYLATEPFIHRAPADVLASIERGLADHAAGRTRDAEHVLSELQERIDAALA